MKQPGIVWTNILLSIPFVSLIGCGLLFEKATPITHGMLRGKVVERYKGHFYAVDLGTVYKPESDTVIFIAGVGRDNHEDRVDWLVEASCNQMSFTRGIGPTNFPLWPNVILKKSLTLVCNEAVLPKLLEHPLGTLSKAERSDFIYSPDFHQYNIELAGAKLVLAVKYWAKINIEMNEELKQRLHDN